MLKDDQLFILHFFFICDNVMMLLQLELLEALNVFRRYKCHDVAAMRKYKS